MAGEGKENGLFCCRALLKLNKHQNPRVHKNGKAGTYSNNILVLTD